MIDERLQMLRESVSTTDETAELVTEIFDTTQPTDSARGTPPLLSRTTEKRERQHREQSRESVESARNDTTGANVSREARAESATDTAVATEHHAQNDGESREEKKRGKNIAWVGFALSLLSLAIIAITIKHRLKRH